MARRQSNTEADYDNGVDRALAKDSYPFQQGKYVVAQICSSLSNHGRIIFLALLPRGNPNIQTRGW